MPSSPLRQPHHTTLPFRVLCFFVSLCTSTFSPPPTPNNSLHIIAASHQAGDFWSPAPPLFSPFLFLSLGSRSSAPQIFLFTFLPSVFCSPLLPGEIPRLRQFRKAGRYPPESRPSFPMFFFSYSSFSSIGRRVHVFSPRLVFDHGEPRMRLPRAML